MIIGLIGVITLAIALVLIPIGWFNKSHDVKSAAILVGLIVSFSYAFDGYVWWEVMTSMYNMIVTIPWVG